MLDVNYRIGRTGRIGRGGISTILFSWSEDTRHARDIRNVSSYFLLCVIEMFEFLFLKRLILFC